MFLAKNLRHLRLKNGFSQDYLADHLGYKSYTTIQKWEAGTSEPSVGVLSELSKIYNVSMNDMFSVDLATNEPFPEKRIHGIPILGTIAAGIPILAEENVQSYFNIDASVNADFAVRVKGDSMLGAGIFPGDIVFIRKQENLENGEIGAVLIENEATLKKFYRNNGTVVLQAENNAYAPIVLTNGSVRILGKLVAVLNIVE